MKIYLRSLVFPQNYIQVIIFIGIILFLSGVKSSYSQDVNSDQWLKLQSKPVFKEGNTLPKLGMMFSGGNYPGVKTGALELGGDWNYYVHIHPRYQSDDLIAAVNSDTASYTVSIQGNNNVNEFTSLMPENSWTRNAQGELIPNGSYYWSPEAPDEAWMIFLNSYMKECEALQAKLKKPIEAYFDWGERDIHVPDGMTYSKFQDPAVNAGWKASGLSWNDYISERKMHYNKLTHDEIKLRWPNILRTLYGAGGMWNPDQVPWFHNYKYMKHTTDYPATQFYYSFFNSGYTGNQNILTQLTHAHGNEEANGSKFSYYWLSAGFTETSNWSDLESWMGFLKMCFVSGSLGGITTGDFHSVDHLATFLPENPAKWLGQMAVLSEVQAVFSHLENYVRNSDLLPGPNKHVWNKLQPAYEFPTSSANTRVMARKVVDHNKWIICAWAADGVERDVMVTIPDLGMYLIKARKCGTVHLVTKDATGVTTVWYDQDETHPSGTACQVNKEGIAVTGISISAPSGGIDAINGTLQLIANVLPINSTNKNVIWKSLDNEIATVNENGLITRKSADAVYIVASSEAGGYAAHYYLKEIPVVVTGVEIAPVLSPMAVFSFQQLKANVLPENAKNKAVTWISSHPEIIKVGPSGLLTALSEGNTTITVITQDGNFSDSVEIMVNASEIEKPNTILYQRWDNINGTLVSDLISNVNFPNSPSYITNLNSMEAASDVAENFGARMVGYIRAPETGSYTFWIASDDNGELWLSSDSLYENKVKIAEVTSWTYPREWNKEPGQKSQSITLVEGKRYFVEAIMKEAAVGDNLAVGWLKPGETGSEPSEIVPGTVLSPLKIAYTATTDISLNTSAAKISAIGGKVTLVATVTPVNASYKIIMWSSSDETIATVSNNGDVTGISQGSTIITATTIDGGFTASCLVSVGDVSGNFSLFGISEPEGFSNDDDYELGLKFSTTQDGHITKIRYFKMFGETGTHTGRIWSDNGTLLASADFVNETVNWWQEVTLSTPLQITANTTYIVSVNANTNYATTKNGLQNIITNGPLKSIADGKNGVFSDIPGSFPSSSFENTNYFRDVVFVANPTSINKTIQDLSVVIYPNPTDGRVYIETAVDTRIDIINILGSVVYSGVSTSNRTEIDLSQKPGMYLVRLNNGLVVKKLIVR